MPPVLTNIALNVEVLNPNSANSPWANQISNFSCSWIALIPYNQNSFLNRDKNFQDWIVATIKVNSAKLSGHALFEKVSHIFSIEKEVLKYLFVAAVFAAVTV